jgi:hypothetical protein
MTNPNYKFGDIILRDDDLNGAAPCTRDIHTFFMQCCKDEDDSPIMVTLRPGTGGGLREKNLQTDSTRYLCNSVICMISSSWMLWM